MRLRVLVLTVGAGCGRVGFEARGLDGGGELGAFGEVIAIDELNTAFNDGDPALTGDQLEMYFDSTRAGGGPNTERIYRSVRPDIDAPWGPAEIVLALAGDVRTVSPGITSDGLTLYVSSQGPVGLDFYVSTRADRDAPWPAGVLVPELSADGEDTNPQPLVNGLEIWFASRRGATARQLFMSTRATTSSPWSTPIPIPALNAGDDVYTGDPWPSSDGTVVYFASDRAGGAGGMDIWRVPRHGAIAFGTPEVVMEVNTPGAQHDPWLSDDQRTIYMSVRDGSPAQLVYARR